MPGSQVNLKLRKGFNRIFIFTLDESKRIVARLPFTIAGPSKLTTSSEVATIKYCELGSYDLQISG